MKMTRSNAFVVALLFSLAACGGQSRSSGSGTNNGTNVGTNNGTNTGGDPGTVTDGGTDGGTGGTGGGTGGTDGGTGVTDGGSTPSVVSVALTSANASIVAGMSQQYAAVATYSDSSEQDVTASATWSVDPAGLGSIDASGNFLGLAAGAGTISATFGGVTGSTSIAVTENVLLSLSLTPSAGSGPLGVDVPFTAMGIFSYGSRDLTAAVTWSTSDPTVATISPTGLLHPVSPGSVEIQAASGPITASTTFTVTDGGTGGGSPYVIGLALTPADASFVAGMSQQYAAVATYSDSSVRDVTATATWSVAPAGLGTFDALGNFVAVAAGAGTISATFGGVTGSTSIAVTENVLQSLSLTPSDDSGPLGVDVPFTAMGIFTNGAQDLTSVVTWTSSDPSIATISSAGVLHPVAPGGPITITATTSGAMAASTTFTVTAAKLTDIAVVPATSTIAQFTTASLQAIGYYSDNTQVDLSDVATWSSDSTAVVLSNGIAYDTGDAIEVAYGASPGSATVTASFGGISDNATVTVTSATLLSIAVDPATIALPAGLSRQVTVTGTFSDGTTQDLTALATWSSSAPAIASVSNAMGSAGLVSLLAPGHATVTANVVVGAVTLTADVSVAVPNAFVKSIAVTGSPTLPAGYKTQFTAIATYSDGSSLDVTKRATWTSSNTEVATISTASPTQGFATGITSGTTIISAKLGGVSGSTSLTVSNARLVSLVVTPGDFTVGVDEHQQLTAIGTFSDGSALDLTTQCMWRSYDKHTAWVSRAGVVTGTSAGTTAILARKRNIKAATVDATVQ
jgi:hypothetical protein